MTFVQSLQIFGAHYMVLSEATNIGSLVAMLLALAQLE
jgi:hypothetical protein